MVDLSLSKTGYESAYKAGQRSFANISLPAADLRSSDLKGTDLSYRFAIHALELNLALSNRMNFQKIGGACYLNW